MAELPDQRARSCTNSTSPARQSPFGNAVVRASSSGSKFFGHDREQLLTTIPRDRRLRHRSRVGMADLDLGPRHCGCGRLLHRRRAMFRLLSSREGRRAGRSGNAARPGSLQGAEGRSLHAGRSPWVDESQKQLAVARNLERPQALARAVDIALAMTDVER
jgi:hypothetical protein